MNLLTARLFPWMVMGVLVGHAGCTKPTSETSCNNDLDCTGRESCQDGYCRPDNRGSSGGTTSAGAASSSGAGTSAAPSTGTSTSAVSSAGGPSSAPCLPPRLMCGTQCVDPDSSPLFCGATSDCLDNHAGTACLGMPCVGGQCVMQCPGALVKCTAPGGVLLCINPAVDNQFCGASGDCAGTAAGNLCAGGMACREGNCACASNEVECHGVCLTAGSCCEDASCAAPQVCAPVAGQPFTRACGCPTGSSACGTSCVTASSCCVSAECSMGQQCIMVGGASGVVLVKECQCPSGQYSCGGACITGTGCCATVDCSGGQECLPGCNADGGCPPSTCVCPSPAVDCPRFGRCVSSGQCCNDNQCPSGRVCADQGMDTTCVCASGTRACGNTCIPTTACCDAPDSCPLGQVCSAAGATCAPGCRISGVAYTSGQANPANPCEICSPGASPSAWTLRTTCAAGDGCCLPGCNANNDADCGATCGNNIVESGEACDGNCPASCPSDGNACTTESLGGAPCHVQCLHTPITTCTGGDGCCAPGCNATNDADCSPSCGNGVVEGMEACDGNCPANAAACNDMVACTTDVLTGAACQRQCGHTPITTCANGDGCCPAGCSMGTDNDCSNSVCGNNVVEAGEECDGNCPASCDDSNACTTDTLNGTGCQRYCTHAAVGNSTNCDDGNLCNGVATCQAGTCTQTTAPVACSALDVCHVAGTCNPANGVCGNPPGPGGNACASDSNPCTSDVCDGMGGCNHVMVGNGTPCGAGQTCQQGACVMACAAPDGSTVQHGQQWTGYGTATVACGNTCVRNQSITCNNGSWTGVAFNTCDAPCASCPLPWGGPASPIAHGSSVTAYLHAAEPYGGTCSLETRTCNNGSLGGSYAFDSCTVSGPASCMLPWGTELASGGSATGHKNTPVYAWSASLSTCNTPPYGNGVSGGTCTSAAEVGTFHILTTVSNAGCPSLRYIYQLCDSTQTCSASTFSCDNGTLTGDPSNNVAGACP